MLRLSEIQSFYPTSLRHFPELILREYLQSKILEIVYTSAFANDLIFMGGTCLRIMHGNQRFSEDIDFDNRGLRDEQFTALADLIKKHLEREGYQVEIKLIMRGAWHCYIRFPGLLFKEGLTGHHQEKILIQLDTEPQDYRYEPERIILNKFDVFTTILTVPLPLLLSQKLLAILNRPRKQGRDFFDVVFLMSKGIQPDFDYLEDKTGITDTITLKTAVMNTCQSLDMQKISKDVEPFLFDSKDRQKIVQFTGYFRQVF